MEAVQVVDGGSIGGGVEAAQVAEGGSIGGGVETVWNGLSKSELCILFLESVYLDPSVDETPRTSRTGSTQSSLPKEADILFSHSSSETRKYPLRSVYIGLLISFVNY